MNSIFPELGKIRLAINLSNVDFPLPFLPNIAYDFFLKVLLKFLIIDFDPKFLETLLQNISI